LKTGKVPHKKKEQGAALLLQSYIFW
jgi:hypothetical protein